MSKLREILWKAMVGSATGNCEPKDLDKFVKEVKQWALSCLPEKEEHIVVITTDGKEGRSVKDWIKKGKNEAIDEIKVRIEEE